MFDRVVNTTLFKIFIGSFMQRLGVFFAKFARNSPTKMIIAKIISAHKTAILGKTFVDFFTF